MDFELKRCCNEANEELYEQGELLIPKSMTGELAPIDISKPYSLGGGVAIANYIDDDGKRKILVAPPGHTLLVGSTGSGKTEGFYLPQIELLGKSKDNVSFVAMDMKGNIFRQKSQMLKDNGFNVLALNGKKPFVSSKYNPLTVIFRAYRRAKDAEKILYKATPQKMEFNGKQYEDYLEFKFDIEQYINENMAYCHQMIDIVSSVLIPIESKDPSWDYGAREIVKSLMYLMLEDTDKEKNPLAEEQFTIYNIANILNQRHEGYDSMISYVKTHNRNGAGYKLMNYIDSQARQTRDSYIMCTSDKLNRVVNLPMNAMSMSSDIDIEELVKTLDTQRTAIFLIADSSNKSIYTLCNLFLVQLIIALQRHGDENPKGDFHIFADEFCNMVPMPDIIDWITTMRSRRTWFHLGIQSYAQLDYHYTPEVRSTIEGNSKTIFMGSNDFHTLDTFSKSVGLTMKVAKSYGIDNMGNLSMSLSSTNVPLVRVSDLANLKLGEAYIKLFGSSGNKIIKTVLQPDFMAEDFAHGNAEPEVIKRHIVSAEENVYSIKRAKDVNESPRRNWDDFFDDMPSFTSNRPKDRDFSENANQTIARIKGIVAKLAEKEKKYILDTFKDKNYDEANKYLLSSKEIIDYVGRFRTLGIIAYSIQPRFELSRKEYELLMDMLVKETSGSPFLCMVPGSVGFSQKTRNEVSDFLKFNMFEANMKTQWKMSLNSEGNYDVELPDGDKTIKLTLQRKQMKLTDNGETFKYLNDFHKDNLKKNATVIDSVISSLGVTKRMQADAVVLEKPYASEKTAMQDILTLYTVIKTVRQIGTLGSAFAT